MTDKLLAVLDSKITELEPLSGEYHRIFLGKQAVINQSKSLVEKTLSEAKTLLSKLQLDSSDPFSYSSYNDVVQHLKSIKETKQGLSVLEKQKSSDFLAVSALKNKNFVLDSFYSSVTEEVTKLYVSKLETILNECYAFIYESSNVRVTLPFTESYGKKVISLKLVKRVPELNRVYEEDIDEAGFSVSVVLGSILAIYFILFSNQKRVLFFDETFTGMADKRLERFFSILNMFKANFGFKFCVITHDKARLFEYGDRIYSVNRGVYSLLEKEK